MSPMLLDSLKDKFKKESTKWLKEVLFKIYGIYIEGPEIDKFLNEDDLFLIEDRLYLELRYKHNLIASFSFDVRGNQVMVMEREKGDLKNFLSHGNISSPDAWKIYAYEDLPNANL